MNIPMRENYEKNHKLSVIIPVYNEKNTIIEILKRVQAVSFTKEIIIVDDDSKDGTRDILKTIKDQNVIVLFHEKNAGKGMAIQTAIEKISGDIVIIQDADLEYNPVDYPVLLQPIVDGRADVVYGSRYLGSPHRILLFWHYLANRLFTLMTNVLYNMDMTDMGTCYKVFRTEVIKSINLKSKRFGIEPEITAKVCKRKYRIYEVPISYDGRTYEEGKKITWKDGLVYIWVLLKYRFIN
jgi:glycosyltransferase involved in cell wall biosynthesis